MRKILTSSLLVLLIISGCAQQRRATQEGTIALVHVTIIDATGAPPQPGMTVVISGSRIVAIGRDGQLKLPDQAQQVDATGKFLIPGLWDMHVHLDDKEVFFPLFLANGVTGLRDMGVSKEVFESLKQLRQQIAKGQLLGPRFVTPGPMLDGPRSFPPVEKIFLTTESEAREAVRWLKQNGSDFIKVHSFPSREVYFAIADEAKKQGLTLVGHLPVSVSLAEAIAAGQKSIEHNIGIPVACSTREAELRQQLLETIKKKRDDWPSVVRADAEATDTYDKQKSTALFSSLVKRGVWVCPTLVAGQSNTMSNHDYWDTVMFKYYPPAVRENWMEETKSASKEEEQMFMRLGQKIFPATLNLVAEMRRAGVQLLAGTDAPELTPGFSLHDELGLLVKAGLTPLEALQAATINPAKFLGQLDSLGTVEKGKLADLVLLDANPLEDIHNSKKINAVIVNGRLLDRKALDELLTQAEAAANKK